MSRAERVPLIKKRGCGCGCECELPTCCCKTYAPPRTRICRRTGMGSAVEHGADCGLMVNARNTNT
jgi:hypothetical protein